MTPVNWIEIFLAAASLIVTIVLFLIGLLLKQGRDGMVQMSANLERTTVAQQDVAKALIELRTVVVGLDGRNGLSSEIRLLRRRVHKLAGGQSALLGELRLTQQKLGMNVLTPLPTPLADDNPT